jgi:hypothetical protein
MYLLLGFLGEVRWLFWDAEAAAVVGCCASHVGFVILVMLRSRVTV